MYGSFSRSRRSTRSLLAGFAALVAASLGACNPSSYATVKNLSSTPLTDARWIFAEEPEVVVTVGTVAKGETERIKIPAELGETSATFLATLGTQTISADCGYLESNGLYLARVVVDAGGLAQCTVEIELH